MRKLYTIQTLEAWSTALARGFLTGDEAYIMEESFLPAYRWMMNQMKLRLSRYSSEFPVWFWLTPERISLHQYFQDDWVVLEAELEDDEYLVSQFEAWHFVLNDFGLDEPRDINRAETWLRIFDTRWLTANGFECEDEDMQAVTGSVPVSKIKVLKYIVSAI